jgi:hypothetical protein
MRLDVSGHYVSTQTNGCRGVIAGVFLVWIVDTHSLEPLLPRTIFEVGIGWGKCA